MSRRYQYILDLLKGFEIDYSGIIVDCGCGPGKGSKLLQDKGFNVIAIDIDKYVLRTAIENKVSNVQFGDLTSLSLLNEYVSVFFCSETLEHLTIKEYKKACEEIFRVVKKGGIICITVPKDKEVCLDNSNHKIWVTKENLLESFKECVLLVIGEFVKNLKKPHRSNLVMIFRK